MRKIYIMRVNAFNISKQAGRMGVSICAKNIHTQSVRSHLTAIFYIKFISNRQKTKSLKTV